MPKIIDFLLCLLAIFQTCYHELGQKRRVTTWIAVISPKKSCTIQSTKQTRKTLRLLQKGKEIELNSTETKFFNVKWQEVFFVLFCFYKFILFIYLFIHSFWLHWVFVAFSSCCERGLLFVAVRGLLIAVASLVMEHGLQAHGLQQLWLAGSRAQAQQLWCTGLVALRHVGSSQTRARTRVPCTGRRIVNHCATREVPDKRFLSTGVSQ